MPRAKPKSRRRTPARTLRPRRRAAAQGRPAIELALAGLAHDIRTPLTGIVALAWVSGLLTIAGIVMTALGLYFPHLLHLP